MGKYDDIIDQLEKAERPSTELDMHVASACGYMVHKGSPTASLDASIAITERLLPGWLWGVDKRGGCLLYKEDAAAKGGYSTKLKVEANTPALSMLLAAFTALQAQDRE